MGYRLCGEGRTGVALPLMISGTFTSGKKTEDPNVFLFISQIFTQTFPVLVSVLGSGDMAMSDTAKVLALWKLKGHSTREPSFEIRNGKDLSSNPMKHNLT